MIKLFVFLILISYTFNSCQKEENISDINILYLHHSTGGVIWEGNNKPLIIKFIGKISNRLANILGPDAELPSLFERHNKDNNKFYSIKELPFPKSAPYGWNNYPYDYYNIWVKNAGEKPFMEEPTLEMLTKDYQVIIFKHCFPSTNIQADSDSADINSDQKTISNYKLQYAALRDKLLQFPDTKFILFTGAVNVKSLMSEEEAKRSMDFHHWVTEEWDIPEDNIFLWDLYKLQTENGLYFKNEYAVSSNDSHPNEEFAGKSVKLLFKRILDVVENNGSRTKLTGESLL